LALVQKSQHHRDDRAAGDRQQSNIWGDRLRFGMHYKRLFLFNNASDPKYHLLNELLFD